MDDFDQAREIARLREVQRLFETIGWRELMEECRREVEIIKSEILLADTWEQTKFLQGRADQLARFQFIESQVESVLASAEHDATQDNSLER